ncbi:MAG: AMP-binding protein [Kiritimatiellia bacterium]|nr:AMP-binding protein [Kiritimatiellia bacterium]
MNANPSFIQNGQYNIGHICTRLQCDRGLSGKTAFHWRGAHGEQGAWTFGNLEEKSSRFANILQTIGFSAGEVFFIFLPKIPEVFFSFLGALKAQIITGTLFSNFGDEALLDRLGDAGAKGILTRQSYLKKLLRIRGKLPSLKFIILVDASEHQSDDILSLPLLMQQASVEFETPLTTPDTPSVLHYTSGSTGKPKGVLHCHRSVLLQNRTATEVLHLQPDDVFWCTADHGWVTGTSYGIIAPWSLGITQVHFGGAYDAGEWFKILEESPVTVWYTAPTALRMLMREEPTTFQRFNLAKLRHIFSVGEPLNPEISKWGQKVLGHDIYDTWWQTETGAIMITNRPGLPIKPGSMGNPLMGTEAAIVSDKGKVLADNQQGNLCLRPGWDSMFISYLHHEDVYRQKFRHGWYMTGDTAYRDSEGYYWFRGRSDDVINTAGHLVSPFEVESALLEVEGIAESGVIGAPDDLLWEKVVAFVALRKGYEWNRSLELKARLHVSNRVSTMATPQEFKVLENIPKNKSGKIMRRVLKAKYLGTDAGDVSTLDSIETENNPSGMTSEQK